MNPSNSVTIRNSRVFLVQRLMVLWVFLLALVSSQAGDLYFAGAGPSATTNRATVIISAKGNPQRPGVSLSSGQPVVHWLSVTSDLSSAAVKFYSVAAPVKVTVASGGGTNVLGLSSTDAASFTTTNQVLIIRHVAADTYERVVNLTPTGNTVKFTPATASAVAANDLIYVASAVGAGLFVGPTTKEFNVDGGIFAGDAGRPLMIEITGTNCAIQGYCGKFRINE